MSLASIAPGLPARPGASIRPSAGSPAGESFAHLMGELVAVPQARHADTAPARDTEDGALPLDAGDQPAAGVKGEPGEPAAALALLSGWTMPARQPEVIVPPGAAGDVAEPGGGATGQQPVAGNVAMDAPPNLAATSPQPRGLAGVGRAAQPEGSMSSAGQVESAGPGDPFAAALAAPGGDEPAETAPGEPVSPRSVHPGAERNPTTSSREDLPVTATGARVGEQDDLSLRERTGGSGRPPMAEEGNAMAPGTAAAAFLARERVLNRQAVAPDAVPAEPPDLAGPAEAESGNPPQAQVVAPKGRHAATMDLAALPSVAAAPEGATRSEEPVPKSSAARATSEPILASEKTTLSPPIVSPLQAAAPAVLDGLEARFQSWLSAASAAGESAAVRAPEVPDVSAQIVQAMRLQWRAGVGEARVQLRPEHLGTVTVSLRVEQGHVVATVRADSAAALEMVRARQHDLQASLASQGLSLDELIVTLDPDERREKPAPRQSEPARPARRQESEARFEVVV